MFIYTDFKFLESTVPYTDFIGLNRFNFTLFPFFINFHIDKFILRKITYNNFNVKKLIKKSIYRCMIIIEVKNSDNLEKALKVLKSKVIKTKQNQTLLERKEYTKKSVKKRSQILKAIYKQKKNQGL